MFTLIEKPLTLSLTALLPAGAHKLLNAARLEPGATNRRYQELTGYQERSIRSFIAALVAVGLAERIQYQPTKMKLKTSDLSAEQQANFERLRTFGVVDSAASRLARTCSTALVEASLRYTRTEQRHNPAGYLIWCLENPHIWFMPQAQAVESDAIEKAVEVMVAAEPALESQERGLTAPPLHEMAAHGVTVTNDNREAVLLAYAVEAATGVDVRLGEEARQTIQSLCQAGYVAEDVAIFTDELFPDQDWRGRKGEKPTLQLLRQGIAATRHRLTSARSMLLTDGLLKRIQAIREYLPDNQPIHCLADLWSNEVQQALVRSKQVESYCPDCGLGWSMCRCGKPDLLPTYKGEDARMWGALIGQLSVQLGLAMFNCWVRNLRLVDFERGQEYDTFTAAAPNYYVKNWLERSLVAAMVETLSKLHQKVVRIKFIVNT